MNQHEPTPTPWTIDPTDPTVIWGPDDLRIATLKGSTIIAGEDNAEHIVRCVNAHGDLVAALEALSKRTPLIHSSECCVYCERHLHYTAIGWLGHAPECPLVVTRDVLKKVRGDQS